MTLAEEDPCRGEYASPEEWLSHLGDIAEAEGKVSLALALYYEAAARGTPMSKEDAVAGLSPELREDTLEAMAAFEVMMNSDVLETIRERALD